MLIKFLEKLLAGCREMEMKKLKYYYHCAKWLWKNRSWTGTRQKYKSMERELKKI